MSPTEVAANKVSLPMYSSSPMPYLPCLLKRVSIFCVRMSSFLNITVQESYQYVSFLVLLYAVDIIAQQSAIPTGVLGYFTAIVAK